MKLNSKKIFDGVLTLCSALMVAMFMLPTCANELSHAKPVTQIISKKMKQKKINKKICKTISNLFPSGDHRNFSVPFEQPSPDLLEYRFDLDKNGKKDIVKAYCGNGLDAVCEMTLFLNGNEKLNFSLPVNIRFIEINKNFYFINGVTINHENKVEIKNYTVHQLLPKKLELTCDIY